MDSASDRLGLVSLVHPTPGSNIEIHDFTTPTLPEKLTSEVMGTLTQWGALQYQMYYEQYSDEIARIASNYARSIELSSQVSSLAHAIRPTNGQLPSSISLVRTITLTVTGAHHASQSIDTHSPTQDEVSDEFPDDVDSQPERSTTSQQRFKLTVWADQHSQMYKSIITFAYIVLPWILQHKTFPQQFRASHPIQSNASAPGAGGTQRARPPALFIGDVERDAHTLARSFGTNDFILLEPILPSKSHGGDDHGIVATDLWLTPNQLLSCLATAVNSLNRALPPLQRISTCIHVPLSFSRHANGESGRPIAHETSQVGKTQYPSTIGLFIAGPLNEMLCPSMSRVLYHSTSHSVNNLSAMLCLFQDHLQRYSSRLTMHPVYMSPYLPMAPVYSQGMGDASSKILMTASFLFVVSLSDTTSNLLHATQNNLNEFAQVDYDEYYGGDGPSSALAETSPALDMVQHRHASFEDDHDQDEDDMHDIDADGDDDDDEFHDIIQDSPEAPLPASSSFSRRLYNATPLPRVIRHIPGQQTLRSTLRYLRPWTSPASTVSAGKRPPALTHRTLSQFTSAEFMTLMQTSGHLFYFPRFIQTTVLSSSSLSQQPLDLLGAMLAKFGALTVGFEGTLSDDNASTEEEEIDPDDNMNSGDGLNPSTPQQQQPGATIPDSPFSPSSSSSSSPLSVPYTFSSYLNHLSRSNRLQYHDDESQSSSRKLPEIVPPPLFYTHSASRPHSVSQWKSEGHGFVLASLLDFGSIKDPLLSATLRTSWPFFPVGAYSDDVARSELNPVDAPNWRIGCTWRVSLAKTHALLTAGFSTVLGLLCDVLGHSLLATQTSPSSGATFTTYSYLNSSPPSQFTPTHLHSFFTHMFYQYHQTLQRFSLPGSGVGSFYDSLCAEYPRLLPNASAPTMASHGDVDFDDILTHIPLLSQPAYNYSYLALPEWFSTSYLTPPSLAGSKKEDHTTSRQRQLCVPYGSWFAKFCAAFLSLHTNIHTSLDDDTSFPSQAPVSGGISESRQSHHPHHIPSVSSPPASPSSLWSLASIQDLFETAVQMSIASPRDPIPFLPLFSSHIDYSSSTIHQILLAINQMKRILRWKSTKMLDVEGGLLLARWAKCHHSAWIRSIAVNDTHPDRNANSKQNTHVDLCPSPQIWQSSVAACRTVLTQKQWYDLHMQDYQHAFSLDPITPHHTDKQRPGAQAPLQTPSLSDSRLLPPFHANTLDSHPNGKPVAPRYLLPCVCCTFIEGGAPSQRAGNLHSSHADTPWTYSYAANLHEYLSSSAIVNEPPMFAGGVPTASTTDTDIDTEHDLDATSSNPESMEPAVNQQEDRTQVESLLKPSILTTSGLYLPDANDDEIDFDTLDQHLTTSTSDLSAHVSSVPRQQQSSTTVQPDIPTAPRQQPFHLPLTDTNPTTIELTKALTQFAFHPFVCITHTDSTSAPTAPASRRGKQSGQSSAVSSAPQGMLFQTQIRSIADPSVFINEPLLQEPILHHSLEIAEQLQKAYHIWTATPPSFCLHHKTTESYDLKRDVAPAPIVSHEQSLQDMLAIMKLQNCTLFSDMVAFLSANPTASFLDFIRWYSPSLFDSTLFTTLVGHLDENTSTIPQQLGLPLSYNKCRIAIALYCTSPSILTMERQAYPLVMQYIDPPPGLCSSELAITPAGIPSTTKPTQNAQEHLLTSELRRAIAVNPYKELGWGYSNVSPLYTVRYAYTPVESSTRASLDPSSLPMLSNYHHSYWLGDLNVVLVHHPWHFLWFWARPGLPVPDPTHPETTDRRSKMCKHPLLPNLMTIPDSASSLTSACLSRMYSLATTLSGIGPHLLLAQMLWCLSDQILLSLATSEASTIVIPLADLEASSIPTTSAGSTSSTIAPKRGRPSQRVPIHIGLPLVSALLQTLSQNEAVSKPIRDLQNPFHILSPLMSDALFKQISPTKYNTQLPASEQASHLKRFLGFLQTSVRQYEQAQVDNEILCNRGASLLQCFPHCPSLVNTLLVPMLLDMDDTRRYLSVQRMHLSSHQRNAILSGFMELDVLNIPVPSDSPDAGAVEDSHCVTTQLPFNKLGTDAMFNTHSSSAVIRATSERDAVFTLFDTNNTIVVTRPIVSALVLDVSVDSDPDRIREVAYTHHYRRLVNQPPAVGSPLAPSIFFAPLAQLQTLFPSTKATHGSTAVNEPPRVLSKHVLKEYTIIRMSDDPAIPNLRMHAELYTDGPCVVSLITPQ